MRKSRVLLAGVAVAAAAAATSAFTASQDLSAGDGVLGYGEATVSGADVDAIHYNRDSDDNSLMESIVFDIGAATPLSGAATASLTLKDENGDVLVTGGNSGCSVVGDPGDPQTIECPTTVPVLAFKTVGLSVNDI
jgi:hypothetical protein